MRYILAATLLILGAAGVTAAPREAGQMISLVCDGTKKYDGRTGIFENSALTVDLSKRAVFHEAEDDGYPITLVDEATVAWMSKDGSIKGRINRATLEALETATLGGLPRVQRYYCKRAARQF